VAHDLRVTGKRTVPNVVLLDDQPLSRAGLRALIEHELDCRVVYENSDGGTALAAAARLAPVVAIVATIEPRSAMELVRALAATPAISCIRLDASANAQAVKAAFDAGALGYLLRGDDAQALGDALRSVSAGRRYLSPLASSSLVDHLQRRDPDTPQDALTPRQLEVLRLVAQGHNTKSIARNLGVSSRTVDAHRYQIGRRLQVHDVAGMVRYAIHKGLVGSEP
jgi:DNA-binding NarL/FixJ family response regulator